MKKSNEQRLEKLKSLVVNRKLEFEDLLDYLERETSFFTAPASHKYHLNYEGGLIEHSLNVAEHMLKIKGVLAPEISDESCVIVGLFHDLGKAGDPGNPYYLINEPTPRQKQYGYPASVPYKHNESLTHLSVPLRSLYYLLPRMPLSVEETQAIMYHDGLYVPDNTSVKCKEGPLLLIAQYADTWSGFIVETGKKPQ